MIGQITPLVKVAGRRVWIQAVVGHTLASAASAAVFGFALGTLGLAANAKAAAWAPTVVAAVLVVGVLRDFGVRACRLPYLTRQTPGWCRRLFGPAGAAVVWGLDLGQGWTTRISFGVFYGVALWAVLSASPLHGAGALAAYGLGRAAPVVLAGCLSKDGELGNLAVWYIYRMRWIQQINASAAGVTAGLIVAASSW